jgi:hypothetical protein
MLHIGYDLESIFKYKRLIAILKTVGNQGYRRKPLTDLLTDVVLIQKKWTQRPATECPVIHFYLTSTEDAYSSATIDQKHDLPFCPYGLQPIPLVANDFEGNGDQRGIKTTADFRVRLPE